MSVLIKGMEMPTDECVALFIYPDGKVKLWRPHAMVGQVYEAVPVPPHGPLVDALDIINTFPDEYVFTNEQARALTNYIIPADKEGEG